MHFAHRLSDFVVPAISILDACGFSSGGCFWKNLMSDHTTLCIKDTEIKLATSVGFNSLSFLKISVLC